MVSIKFPDSIGFIGNGAFSYCINLKSISISENITFIAENTFYSCLKLIEISLPNTITSIGQYSFYQCESLSSFQTPSSVTNIGKYAFASCNYLKSIFLPNSIISIGCSAFSACINLKSVNIPASVIYVGDEAFNLCKGIESVSIQTKIDKLEINVFKEAFNMAIIEFGNEIDILDDKIFKEANSIKSIIFEEKVTKIDDNAFINQPNLTSIEFKKGVIYIGRNTFSNCCNLKTISILGSSVSVENNQINSHLSSIILFDEKSETKIYNYYNIDEKREDNAILIDIAKPINRVSLNLFKVFNTISKKVIINNLKTKSTSNIDDTENKIADTIVFSVPENNNIASLLSLTSFEVLGGVNNFIFTNPNGIIVKKLTCKNISKFTLATGFYSDIGFNVGTINKVFGKLSLLESSNDKEHLALDASELDELDLYAREIEITGEIIVKGSLIITTGFNQLLSSKPNLSFQTSSFGNIQASSIKLSSLEPYTNVKVAISFISTIDSIYINLREGNLLLSGSNATRFIAEQSSLTILANNLTLNNFTISSKNDIIISLVNNLVNTKNSMIYTQPGGNITIQLQKLNNYEASIIQSGGSLNINGIFIDNIGIDNEINKFKKTFTSTGLSPGEWQTVKHGQEKVDVSLTTSPSQILAEGDMSLKADHIQNKGSNIISKQKLIINGITLNNEMISFTQNVKYVTHKHYRGEYRITCHRWKIGRHRTYEHEYRDYWNLELFYSKTPSIIMGNTVEIILKDIITQDTGAMNKDNDFTKSGSRIESNDELYIKAKKILNNGILISSKGKENIMVDEELTNIGGVIVSRKGGIIKTNKLDNKDLKKQFNAGGTIFSEIVQPSIIGISNNPKHLALSYEGSDIKSESNSNDQKILIIEAKEIKNIGSFLINFEGTTKIIADKFKSVAEEVRNRIDGGNSVLDVTQNYKAGILGNNIDINIKEESIIAGTQIKATNSIKLKARQLAIEDVKNKYYEENTIEEKTLFSKSRNHNLMTSIKSLQSEISAPTIEIETDDNINIVAPIINGESLSIISKNGNINIEGTVEEFQQQSEYSKKDFAGITGSISWNGVSVGTKSNLVESSESRYDSKNVSSMLRATKSFFARAKGFFRAKSADITGNDITIEAQEGDVIIESMLEQHNYDSSHKELTTIVSFKVGNTYTDIAATSLATSENVKRVEEALENLNHIRELYDKKEASEKALRNAAENFAILSANAGMSSLQVLKAVSASVGTTATGGFYAIKDINTFGSKKSTEARETIYKQGSITGNNIKIKAGNNAKIQGEVSGDTSIELDINGDLSVESVQDKREQYTDQKQLGYTVGEEHGSTSFGSQMSEYKSKETKKTIIQSEGSLNINVKGNLNLKGSTIANENEDKLSIKAKDITHSDLENEQHNLNTGIQFQTGLGTKVFQGTTTVGLTDQEKVKESITRATISKGKIEVDSMPTIDNINRDITSVDKITRNEIVSDSNFDITLDNRLFTKEGRKQIANDIKDSAEIAGIITKKLIFNPLTNKIIAYIKRPSNKQLNIIYSDDLSSSNAAYIPKIAIDNEVINYARQLFELLGIELVIGDTIVIPSVAIAGGTYLLYRSGKLIAKIVKDKIEAKQQMFKAYIYDDKVSTSSSNLKTIEKSENDENKRDNDKQKNDDDNNDEQKNDDDNNDEQKNNDDNNNEQKNDDDKNSDDKVKKEKKNNIYDKVHRDKKGNRKIKGFQEHHIISNKNEATKDDEIWKSANEDIESRHNKIFLPEKEENHETRTPHRGKHWKSVSDEIKEKMKKINEEGKQKSWSEEEYRNELRKIQNEERQKLRRGERDLNSINRHN